MTNAKLAELYQTSTRSIRRWRSDGAPLNNPEAMKSWLASRRTMATATVGGQGADKPSKSTSTASTSVPTNGEHGAAAALDRLEEAEEKAFRALDEALTAGDPIRARAARKAWLDIAVVLAKLDSQVSESRRTAQELYPRETLETMAQGMAYYVRLAVQGTLKHLVNEHLQIKNMETADFTTRLQKLSDEIRYAVVTCLHSAIWTNGFPDWLKAAIARGATDAYRMSTDEWTKRAESLVEIMDFFVKETFRPAAAAAVEATHSMTPTNAP